MSVTTTGKIGFHFGSESTASGYGDYVRELDAAGIPATVMSVSGEGFGDIVGVWNNGSNVPHVAVIRCLSHNDVPRYDLPIDDAVTDWLDRYVPTIGADVAKYHDRVITKHGNELDRNKIQWLADFYIALHPRLLERMGWESHRICIFNFAGGNPDPDQWELILPQLKIFANNPDKFVIGCHEYSFNDADIWANDGGGNYLIGRFKYLFDTCDRHNIKRPLYVIHEWGWRDVKIPNDIIQALADIDQVNELYCWYPEIVGAGIWTLQKWQESEINTEVQKLIQPVKELTLTRRYNVNEEAPPMNKPKIVIVKKPQISQMTLEENQQVSQWAFENYGRTATHSHDDMFSMLESGNSESHAIVWWGERQPEVVQMLIDHGYKYELRPEIDPQPGNPLDGLKLGYLFSYQYSDSYSPFNDPRNYGNGLHEGLDADVIGGLPDNKVNVLCTYAGVVDRSLDSTGGYGKYIRVQHERNGSPFYTRYCHLDTRLVNVGDTVAMGQPLGEVGATGNVTGEHVHFNLEVPNYGLRGYVVDWVVDPFPYLPSDNMSLPPISGKQVSIRKYFEPVGEYGRKIVFRFPDGRTQPQQLQRRADGSIVLWKGEGQTIDGKLVYDYERFSFDAVGNLIRHEDTSVGGRDAYDQNGAVWLPSVITEGQTYTNTLTITNYDRGSCQQIAESTTTDYIKFAKFHASWNSPQNTNITLTNVIELEWRKSPNGNVIERYFLAEGMLYCAWNNGAIHEFADGQQNLGGNLSDC